MESPKLPALEEKKIKIKIVFLSFLLRQAHLKEFKGTNIFLNFPEV